MSAPRDPPVGRDRGQRVEHEGAARERADGGWSGRASATCPPLHSDDVEIEHARRPSAAGAAAEVALDRLERGRASPAGRARFRPARRHWRSRGRRRRCAGLRRIGEASNRPKSCVEPGDRRLDHAAPGGRGGRAGGWSRWRWRRGALRRSRRARLGAGAMPFASPADLSPIPRPKRRAIARLCPRLVAFRHECRAEHPDWWNAPVPAFGDPRGVAGDHRPRAGQAWRQPHRAAVHRRLCRRAALRDLAQIRAGRGRLSRRPGRRAAAQGRDHPQCGQMPAAAEQAAAAARKPTCRPYS